MCNVVRVTIHTGGLLTDAVIEALRNEDEGVRRCAAEILATTCVHPDPETADALSRVFVEEDADVWEKAVVGLSMRFDVRVAGMEMVRRYLGHKDALVRESAGRGIRGV